MVEDFPEGKFGGTMISTTPGDIATLNPFVAEDYSSAVMISHLQSKLVTVDPNDGSIIPSLAKSWDISEDGLVYTFYIRKGVCWSDGNPFTAHDVQFTWDTAFMPKIDPETGEPVINEETGRTEYKYTTRMQFQQTINGKLVKVDALDDYTVRFTLPERYAPFLVFGGLEDILPKHQLEGPAKDGTLMDQWNLQTAKNEPWKILSLGMFVLESYRPGERLVFRRNPNYWKVNNQKERLAYVDRMIVKIVPDYDAGNIAFLQGHIDFEEIKSDNYTLTQDNQEKFDYTVFDNGPSTSSNFIWFNLNPGKNDNGEPYVEPHKFTWFSDKRFRKAIQHGINRPGIINGVYFGRANLLHSLESRKNKFWYNENIKTYDYDPAKSMELLREAGFQKRGDKLYGPEGNPVKFSLMTNQSNGLRTEMATVFKENMAELGIHVDLQFLDFNNIIIRTSDSFDYDACMLGFRGGNPEPFSGKDIYMSGGRLHQWYPEQPEPATEWEARIDELMIELGRQSEPLVRQKLYHEVQAILAEELPMIFLVTENEYIGYKNRWQNIQPTSLGGVTWNLESLWAK